MLWQSAQYIRHLVFFKKRKGHGIHAPYMFDWVSRIIFDSEKLQVPGEILSIHKHILKDRSMLSASSPGMPSRAGRSRQRSVASFIRHSSVSKKHAKLLYRIAYYFQPDMILELGSGLGLSALYLSAGAPGIPLHSIEGAEERAAFASALLAGSGMEKAVVHRGDIGKQLEMILPGLPGRFLAFLDGNHHRDPTLEYAGKLIKSAGDEAVIVLDDIYWSKGMFRAWEELKSRPEVTQSIDLFHMGILFLRKDLEPLHIKIQF